jgi:hypothetical protein
LAEGLAQAVGIGVTTVEAPFKHWVSQREGVGCLLTASGTELDLPNVLDLFPASKALLESRGWYEDNLNAGGGGGSGAIISGFTQANGTCQLSVISGPLEDELCSDDEPIFVCMEGLSPEQRLHTVTIHCAQDTTAAVAPQDEPARIQFAPGATSAQLSGSLFAGQIHQYVLGAAAGQQMAVHLYTSSGGNPFPGGAVLVIWGADGTVLISDHAGAADWVGELPLTQDYYVDVRSAVPSFVDYVLQVSIPLATEGFAGKVFPLVEPLEFQPYLQALVLTGVPIMLPPEFPVGQGLPPIYPYIYTAGDGLYELSLDYGADCQGAGACHYGSMMAQKVDSSVPLGTANVPFDAERAQEVLLANDIQGYFVESACGASCSDAQVFWVHNGYQYMLGLKAGLQQDVLDLANAAILNSMQ